MLIASDPSILVMEGKEKRKKPPRRANSDKDSCLNCDQCGVKVNPDASTTRKCLLCLGILFCSKECKTKSKGRLPNKKPADIMTLSKLAFSPSLPR